MFCDHCGAHIEEGARFCEKCGARVSAPEQAGTEETAAPIPETAPAEASAVRESVTAPDGESRRAAEPSASGKAAPSKKTGLIIAAAAVVVLLLLIVTRMGGKKINLNNYLTITASGYDTVGNASYTFDTESFLDDYEDKIKFSSKAEDTFGDWLNYIDAPSTLASYVSGSLDQSSGLSNGDVITFTWSISDDSLEEIEECFNYSVKFSDIEYTVEGLESVGSFDPFADIELAYSGTAPDGYVEVQNSSTLDAVSALRFSVSPSSGLSNGDTVVVSLSNTDMDYFAETYGMVPSETTKEYTVDGLASYVTTLAEIPDSTMEQLQSQCEDVISAYVANDWNTEAQFLNGMTCLGSYLLTPKNGGTENDLYMVYKIQSHEYNEEHGIDTTYEYYTTIAFYDLVIEADGSCSVDLTDYSLCSEKISRLLWEESFWSNVTLHYKGYETLDELYTNCVTKNIDRYNCESSVEDAEI
ncbi:MAG: zinc ribbon domain-containing protein [Lachnospiraceae bacterium]|nr:zinc ribbon domain-containing protein [Lachnospiraceae bacterium]